MDESVGQVIRQMGPLLVVRPAKTPTETRPHRIEPPQPAAREEYIPSQAEKERTSQAVEMANVIAEFLDKKISFSYDKRINQVIVKIVRESTDEVIRQVPPEEMIELMARLRDDFRGLIFNHTG